MDRIFAVYVPGRKENSGGHVVLHKFVKILCDLGEEVWINTNPLFSCNAKIIKEKTIKSEIIYDMSFSLNKKLIAVYPEQIEGNPFKAEYVARWILYHTKNDVENTWSDKDVYFYYLTGFNTIKKKKKRILNVIDSKVDIFFNQGFGDKRSGYCHIIKKNHPTNEKMLTYLKSTDLSDFMEKGGFSYLANQLNQHEYFLTYDNATYYSIIAALCGCRSIILTLDNSITPEEWREQYHLSKYGISYGWNDIKHADLTRDMVRDYLKKMEKESIRHVKEFINFWSKA